MLKIQYVFKVPKQNIRFTKLSFFTLNLLWLHLSNNPLTSTNVSKSNKIKTLMLSPFHYKVAKKNITNSSYRFKFNFDLRIDCKKQKKLIIFKNSRLLGVYFIFAGLTKLQFKFHDVKFLPFCKTVLVLQSVGL